MTDPPIRHPDSPGPASVDEELTDATQESMGTLGRADLDEEVDPVAAEQDDSGSEPGQNSDWVPQ
jgi:hypothetical protein